MRRLLIAALLLCLPSLADAETCTSAGNGDWDSGVVNVPWSGCTGNIPTADDVVVIVSPHTVTVDAAGAVAASTSVASGSALNLLPGGTLTIGDAATGTNNLSVSGLVRVFNSASLIMSADSGDQTLDRIIVNSGGALYVHGRSLATGAITVEPTEAIPGNADQTITDSFANFSTAAHAGKFLMFTSGDAKSRVYTIASVTNTSTLVLDQTNDAHGNDPTTGAGLSPYTETTGRVDCDGTATVTCDPNVGGAGVSDCLFDNIPAAGRCLDTSFTRGECFVGQDIEIAGVAYHIIDFTDVGASAADTFKIRGTCPVAVDATYALRHWNATSEEAPGYLRVGAGFVNSTRFVKMFTHEGDSYVIYSPATISVPAANKSTTDSALFTSITCANGSVCSFRYADVAYSGNSGARAIYFEGIDSASGSESMTLEYSEVHDYGSNIGIQIVASNATIRNIWVRDSVQMAGIHPINFGFLAGFSPANMTLKDSRFSRNSDESSTTQSAIDIETPHNLTLDGNIFEQHNWGPLGASGGGFEAQCLFGGTFKKNIFAHATQPGLLFTNSLSTTCIQDISVVDNVFLNVSLDGCTGVSLSDDSRSISYANNWIESCRLHGIRGATFAANNFILNWGVGALATGNPATNHGGVVDTDGVFGNILVGHDSGIGNESSIHGLTLTSSCTVANHPPVSLVRWEDNVVFARTGLKSWIQNIVSTATCLGSGDAMRIKHNHFEALEFGEASPTLVVFQFGFAGDTGVTFTVEDNVIAGLQYGLRRTVAAGATNTIDYNVYTRINDREEDGGCPGCLVGGANEITTARESFVNWPAFDARIPPGSPLLTLPASDGTIRGPRIAGIVVERLPIPGYLLQRGFTYLVNNTTTKQVDTDGDGIFDLFDNCQNRMNPTQVDTDGNGNGDAC